MKILVRIENGKRVDVLDVETREVIGPGMSRVLVRHRLAAWVDALLAKVEVSGVCLSFVVSAHVEPCDHGVQNGKSG